MSRCTADHNALKTTHALWIKLELVGVQVTEADAYGPEERLELRDFSCGSTLSRSVTIAASAS